MKDQVQMSYTNMNNVADNTRSHKMSKDCLDHNSLNFKV